MAIAYNPRTITDGLVLCLDAANPKSYPGSGTTWTDLSGRGNTGTLTNGPTYSSSNGGSIVFDGTNDFVDCGNNSSINPQYLTFNIWVKFNTFSGRPHFGKGSGSNGAYYIVIETSSQYRFYYTKPGNNWSSLSGSNLSTNVWYNLIVSYDGNGPKMYINGILDNSSTDTGTLSTSDSNNLTLGRRSDTPVGTIFGGNIAQVSIYNRALSATEISQNFNATKSRYGL